MTQQWYKRTTEAAMKGMRVRSIVPLRNGLMEAPVGTVFTIVGKRAGLDLSGVPCPACGVAIYIRKVLPHQVVLLDNKEAA